MDQQASEPKTGISAHRPTRNKILVSIVWQEDDKNDPIEYKIKF